MAYDNTKEMATLIATLNPLLKSDSEFLPQYLHTAFALESALAGSKYRQILPSSITRLMAVTILGYMLETRAGNGLWQVFLRKHHELYGTWLPFALAGDDYEPGQLNRADVYCIVWMTLAGYSQRQRYIYPLSAGITEVTDALWHTIEQLQPFESDLYTVAELRKMGPTNVCELVYWRHWLLLPSFEQDRINRVAPLQKQIEAQASTEQERATMIADLHRDIMSSLPTGPLALGISDWVAPLMGMRRKASAKPTEKPEHKYYTQFMKATGGKNPIYLATYDELNRFLSDGMQWGDDEHFPSMRHHRDFVLYTERENGLLICKDVARCIADPENELYDKDYAVGHAFSLLSERGLCAPDLLKLCLTRGWLPDTMFPTGNADEQNEKLTTGNADMIARFYLQQYYTGD